jgi:hypothetical protein
MNGRGGFAMQLLVEDGLQQRFKRRRQSIEAQGERPGSLDESAELGVAIAEMGHRFIGIEGKFSVTTVVEHENQSTAFETGPGPWNRRQ